VAARGRSLLAAGEPVRALWLAEGALAADSSNADALELKASILHALIERSRNVLETGWLRDALRPTVSRLCATERGAANPMCSPSNPRPGQRNP
jgi:hypothetical protein